MGDVLVSVIVPVYNTAEYIERCVESIRNQTYRNLEIILVDDGSTDSSLEIMERCASVDKRIRVFHKEKGGTVSTRKFAIQQANGQYTASCDSDDWIESEMIETLLDFAVKNDADVVTTSNIKHYGNEIFEEPQHYEVGLYKGKRLEEEILNRFIEEDYFYQENMSISIVNKLIKTPLLKKWQMRVDGEITQGEDFSVTFPLIYDCKSIYITDTAFYHYCWRIGSTTQSQKEPNSNAIDILFRYLNSEMSPLMGRFSHLKKQMYVMEMFFRLTQNPDQVITYKDGILYPFGEVSKSEKVAIYGNGEFGQATKFAMGQLGFSVDMVFDRNPSPENGVFAADEVSNENFDKIIIGVLKAKLQEQIEEYLLRQGIDKGKILMVNLGLM